MINGIWLAMILASVLCAAFTGRMDALQQGVLDGARSAVDLVIGLVGLMILFLGLMRVACDGGLLHAMARAVAPILRRLFREVPSEHPAMGAIIMNLASNVLGLGNAATPFGLKAMVELNKLNTRPGVATDAMVLFLAINASSVTLLPLGTASVRAAAGSNLPLAHWVPTLLGTAASTLVAVAAFYLLRRLPRFRLGPPSSPPPETSAETDPSPQPEAPGLPPAPAPMGPRQRILVWGFLGILVIAVAAHVVREARGGPLDEVVWAMLQTWLLPALIAGLVLVGVRGRVRVYEAAVEGGKEGLEVAVRIVPFLVIILVAVAMFRASGALELLIGLISPMTGGFVPAEALPMALLRPLSGSGAFGVMSEILTVHRPDSFIGLLVSSYQGTTETTSYVLALYLGAARVRDGRHALAACLCGDLAGFVVATAACHLLFG
jgi:spore maturation protein SpmA